MCSDSQTLISYLHQGSSRQGRAVPAVHHGDFHVCHEHPLLLRGNHFKHWNCTKDMYLAPGWAHGPKTSLTDYCKFIDFCSCSWFT